MSTQANAELRRAWTASFDIRVVGGVRVAADADVIGTGHRSGEGDIRIESVASPGAESLSLGQKDAGRVEQPKNEVRQHAGQSRIGIAERHRSVDVDRDRGAGRHLEPGEVDVLGRVVAGKHRIVADLARNRQLPFVGRSDAGVVGGGDRVVAFGVRRAGELLEVVVDVLVCRPG